MDSPSRTPVAEVPLSFVRDGMVAVIAVLALGGLATQTFAILTGHGSLFGLIPKFDPGGTRNLFVWFASMTLAGTAILAAIAGIAARADHRAQASGWWAVAAVLLTLSIGRMTSIGSLLSIVGVSTAQRTTAVALFVVAVCMLAILLARWASHLSRGPRLRLTLAAGLSGAGFAMCHLGLAMVPSASTAPRVGYAVWMTAGRALELAGLLLFVMAVIAHVRSGGRPVLVRLDDDRGERPGEDRKRATVDLHLSLRRVRLGLIVTVAGASAASMLAVWARLHLGERAETLYRLLNVDFEGNLPTWISAVLLLLSAGAAGLFAATARHAGDRRWRRWVLLAAVFVMLSADEAASFHELLVEPLRALVGGTPWLRYPLILPGLVVVTAGAVTFGRLIATLEPGARGSFYRGVGLFFLGALVIETIGGWFDPTIHGENAVYVVLSTLEEACEMMGAALVFVALVQQAGHTSGTLRLSAGGVGPAINGLEP